MISTEVTFRQGGSRSGSTWCCGATASRWWSARRRRRSGRPYTWIDGAAQIHDDYEKNVPQFFVPNVFSFATEGKDFRYGTVGMPVELWGPWREEETDDDAPAKVGLQPSRRPSRACCSPTAVLDFLRFFTIFATDKKHRKIKIIARFQQFQATNLIVERVLLGPDQAGPDLALPGLGQVAADGVHRAEAAARWPALTQPDDPDRGRPHRPGHPDHRHVQRLRRAGPGVDRLAARSCRRC